MNLIEDFLLQSNGGILDHYFLLSVALGATFLLDFNLVLLEYSKETFIVNSSCLIAPEILNERVKLLLVKVGKSVT